MSRLMSYLCLSLSIFLAGCVTTYKVATDYDEKFDFKDKHTYALMAPENVKIAHNDLVKERIEMALHSQLKANGLTQVDKESADIWISYFGSNERQTDINSYEQYNGFYGYNRCYRCVYTAPMTTTSVQTVNYVEGTLMVDFIDPATKKLKWRGSTSSRATTSKAAEMTLEERDENVNAAVSAILAEYPAFQE
ncbi:MAG: DUF4136 domain-containing protein [Pseudomonadales bacterium]|nr:DUF4136 domain-containing protein [Pseudomonadales bacterium]